MNRAMLNIMLGVLNKMKPDEFDRVMAHLYQLVSLHQTVRAQYPDDPERARVEVMTVMKRMLGQKG